MLTDRQRTPFTFGFGHTDHISLALSLKAFVDKHKWRTIAVICDQLTGHPSSAFYTLHCNNIRRLFPIGFGLYDIRYLSIDSARTENINYTSVLLWIRRFGRGKFLMFFVISSHIGCY